MTYDVGELLRDLPPDVIEWLAEWHCFLDACHICQNLNGYPFSGFGDVPPILTHPQWGNVWDVDNGCSLTHDHCRCSVTIHVRIDFGKIPHVTEVCRAMGIDPPNPEMFEVTDIADYREEVGKLHAYFGDIHSDAREIEYILYRVTGVLKRMGLPAGIDAAMSALQHTVLTARMLGSMEMYLSRGGAKNLALAAVSGAGAFITIESMLMQYGQESQKALLDSLMMEQQTQIAATQLELRRKRW